MLARALARRLGGAIAAAGGGGGASEIRIWQQVRHLSTQVSNGTTAAPPSPPPLPPPPPPSPSSPPSSPPIDIFEHRTQRKPIYTMPHYGAGDDEITSLSDAKAKEVLHMYGGLIRKDDTGEDWRTRLRKITRAWHIPKQLTISGVVVSDKMIKSVVIASQRRCYHPKYRKYFNKTHRFMAHDGPGLCREGDHVIIRSCRPLSKRKAHVVVQNFGDKMRSGVDDRKVVLDNE